MNIGAGRGSVIENVLSSFKATSGCTDRIEHNQINAC